MFHGFFFLVFVVLYFLPAIIGSKKHNATAILLVNLLLGWTVIGWIVALVWALSSAPGPGFVSSNVPPWYQPPPYPQAPYPQAPYPPPSPQPPPPAAAPASPQVRQIFCSQCGAPLTHRDKFCASCGTSVPVA